MAENEISKNKQVLNLAVVTADQENDLYRTLTENFKGIELCDSLDDALALTDHVKGIMILADYYPHKKTPITSEQANAILASDVRVYVEYPENHEALGITGYSGIKVMGSNRGVVTDAAAMNMPLYSLLYVNGARFIAKSYDAREAGSNDNPVWMVSAKVAGYDVGEYGLTNTEPYVLLEENNNVLVAATKFSQWISARYAPYERYQTFWASILTWLNHGESVPVMTYNLAVHAAHAENAPLTKTDYVNAVRRNADWFFKSGFLLNDTDEKAYRTLGRYGSQDYTLHPDGTGDGSNGVIETFSAGAQFKPDGSQKIRFLRRADCNAETAGSLAMAYYTTGDERYKNASTNLVNWLLCESSLAGGPRADADSPQYGLLDWDDGPTTPEQYYGDDNARAILGLIEAVSVLGEDGERFEQRLLEAILANFRTSGKNGFRGHNIHASELEQNGWEYYYNREITLFAPHYESMLWGPYLWAYEKTGWEPLLERTKTGIAMMMDAYEKDAWQWTNGLQQERAKMTLSLAWLVRLEPTEKHEEWLHRMVNDLMMFQQDSGGIQERLGKGQGTFGSYKSNASYGGAEAPIIQNNGDPCVDNLYTQPFACLGLNEAMHATSNAAYREEYAGYLQKLTDFIVRTQQVSDVYEEFDGVWFRAFDYDKWETYGSDGDHEWGVWTTETGWTQAWLNSGISMRVADTCIWDLSSDVDLTDDFALVSEIMLDEIIGNENNAALQKSVSVTTCETDASFVTDGKNGTYWQSGAGDENPAVIVDLQGRYILSEIRMMTGSEDHCSAFRVYTSLDGEQWSTVHAEKMSLPGTMQRFRCTWTDNTEETRFVKVEGTASSDQTPFVVHEIRAYGELVSTELENAIYSAEAVDPRKFTKKSVQELNEILAQSKVVYENPKASEDEISHAAEALRRAKEALVSLKPKAALVRGDIQNYSIDTLVDGVNGSLKTVGDNKQIFCNGTYVGVLNSTLVAKIDLNEVKTFDELSIGFLKDGDRWGIGFPASVSFRISRDGSFYDEYDTIDLSTYSTNEEACVYRIATDAGEAEAQYILITVTPRDNVPWFFLDEFTVHETEVPGETDESTDTDAAETVTPVESEESEPEETALPETEEAPAADTVQSSSLKTGILIAGAAAVVVGITVGGFLVKKKLKNQ